MLFTRGDLLAGILVGTATALGVRAIVWPGMGMVLAMLAVIVGLVVRALKLYGNMLRDVVVEAGE